MLITKELVSTKKNGEKVYKKKFNKKFWKETQEKYTCINIVLDEVHQFLNPRRGMSADAIIMTDFLSMIRRMLGSTPAGSGTLTMITQLPRRIDGIAREMATQIRHCRSHYTKECTLCKANWPEHSDLPEPAETCRNCGSDTLFKHTIQVEVWHFATIHKYEAWYEFGEDTHHMHYLVGDVADYFKFYNTLQWDAMFSDDDEEE
jgi:hypothetical protein